MCAWTSPRTYVDEEVVTAAILNVDLRDNMLVASTHAHGGAAGAGNDELAGVDSIAFDDLAASPDAAGELQRNGVNLEWYGAAVVRFTEVNAASNVGSPRTLEAGGAAPYGHEHVSSNHALSLFAGLIVDLSQAITTPREGRYDFTDTQTKTIYDKTTSQKIGAFAFRVFSLEVVSGASGVLTASLDADGVEIVSVNRTGTGIAYPAMLMAVKLKASADIRFIARIARTGTAGAAIALVEHLGPINDITSTPNARVAEADIGVA